MSFHPKARVTFVVAMAENRVIGRDNGLAWHIGSDLKRFKAATLGKPMIMGRKTFLSIGKPLPGRETIVLTRDKSFAVEGVHVATSIDDALRQGEALALSLGVDEITVAGGGDVYQQMMDRCDRIIMTYVQAAPEGDAFFPAFEHLDFHETARESYEAGPRDDHAFTIVTYERRKTGT
ncbi:MAG: dihydrofolate reductase [Hyphomicrobiales bacterium]